MSSVIEKIKEEEERKWETGKAACFIPVANRVFRVVRGGYFLGQRLHRATSATSATLATPLCDCGVYKTQNFETFNAKGERTCRSSKERDEVADKGKLRSPILVTSKWK